MLGSFKLSLSWSVVFLQLSLGAPVSSLPSPSLCKQLHPQLQGSVCCSELGQGGPRRIVLPGLCTQQGAFQSVSPEGMSVSPISWADWNAFWENLPLPSLCISVGKVNFQVLRVVEMGYQLFLGKREAPN